MMTGQGGDARDETPERENQDRRGERIGIGGGDDSVTRIQLAARWAESFSPQSDSLGGVLKRFRAAYDYLDAVIHGVEPPDLEREAAEAPSSAPPAPVPSYSSSSSGAPNPPEQSPPPPPPAESRPWA
jgi:hypothetical protein